MEFQHFGAYYSLSGSQSPRGHHCCSSADLSPSHLVLHRPPRRVLPVCPGLPHLLDHLFTREEKTLLVPFMKAYRSALNWVYSGKKCTELRLMNSRAFFLFPLPPEGDLASSGGQLPLGVRSLWRPLMS